MELQRLVRVGVVLFSATVVTGCLPLVSHGPAVHPGDSGGLAVSLLGGSTYQSDGYHNNVPALVGGLQLILRQGTTRGPFGAPAHVGVQLQPFSLARALSPEHEDWRVYFAGSDLDLYTQLKSSGNWDRGVGVLAGPDHVAPYYEFGPKQQGSGTWFVVTQGSYIDTFNGHIVAGSATIARTEAGFRGRAAHLMLTVYSGRSWERGGGLSAFTMGVATLSLDFFGGKKQADGSPARVH